MHAAHTQAVQSLTSLQKGWFRRIQLKRESDPDHFIAVQCITPATQHNCFVVASVLFESLLLSLLFYWKEQPELLSSSETFSKKEHLY